MRSKEDAHDYRYFPDPDLPPLVIAPGWIEQVREAMPELPLAMAERFVHEHGLPASDATQLTQDLATARYFEAAARALPAPGQGAKPIANWMMGELARRLNAHATTIDQAPVGPAALGRLVGRIGDGTLSNSAAKQVFDALWSGEGGDVDAIIEARGLRTQNDAGALTRIVEDVIAANPKSVAEFRGGKEKALNALVGQAMKASRGKADPEQVMTLLRQALG
jgi:aspartyl-tRNA(Asn)/glutamyl-tRNA(Gln) amidotransferase subunit B